MTTTNGAMMLAEAMSVAEIFETHRRHLFGVAYRMLGSRSEADDVVQEAFLRWQATPREQVRSDRALLTTIVTRLCLDQLKSARARRVDYVGPWLPEPVRTDAVSDSAVDAESISLAFLVMLESLSPVERAVYLMAEVFDHSHAEIAEIVGRDEVTCRQILRRAREQVAARRPRFAPSRERHHQLLASFATACIAGDLGELKRLLADDVTASADGGGRATAARKEIRGIDAVSRYYLKLTEKRPEGTTAEIADINGWATLILRVDGNIVSVISIETDGDRIHAVRAIVNPDKLTGL